MEFQRVVEDFLVEELSDVRPVSGEFGLYRLIKRDLGTLEAVAELATRLGISRQRISYGGLKDRRAVTRQFLTIEHGQPERLATDTWQLEYLGTLDRPFRSREIRGNRFTIVLRQIQSAQQPRLEQALAEVRRDGLVNYFDEQRFGSLGLSRQFIADAWHRQDYERAVWLAAADDHAHDSSAERQAKQSLRKHWGRWDRCRGLLSAGPAAKAMAHLARRPGDFRGALCSWPAELRSLWLSAYQSWLWNRIASRWLVEDFAESGGWGYEIAGQELVWPRQLNPPQREPRMTLDLPLPSARGEPPEGPLGQLVARVLAEQGTSWNGLRIDFPRENFFARGERPLFVEPGELQSEFGADELSPGQLRCRLRFTLPRASYATLLVKRLELALAAC